MGKIIILKHLLFKSNLSFLAVGDIIWANRYLTEAEKETMEEGHQTGPFIIILKTKWKVYALACTGTKSKNPYDIIRMMLPKNSYTFSKDCYVYVGRLVLLHQEQYLKVVGHLNTSDLNRIYKRMFLINKNLGKVKYFPKRKIKFIYTYGDVILYNKQLFYIKEENEEYYITIPLQKLKNEEALIKINGVSYGFNFHGEKKISKKAKIELINTTDNFTHQRILSYEKRRIKELAEIRKLNRGKLITCNNKYYFIYGEYQNKLLVYQIYLDKDATKNMIKIKIRNGDYYTKFEEILLNPSSTMQIVRIALEEEIQEIKRQRQEYHKKRNGKKAGIIKKEYQTGCILIEDKTLNRFVILKRCNNEILYVSLSVPREYRRYNFENPGRINCEVLEKMDDFAFYNITREQEVKKRVEKFINKHKQN